MKIIEKFIEGKDINKDCDDGLFINDNFIAVIDGVTSKGKLLWNGKRSGTFAKDIIAEELENMSPEIDAYSAIKQLNNKIKGSYGDRYSIAEQHVEEKIAATIIIFSKFRNEVWIFGDCQCLVNGKHFDNPKKIDAILSEVRSLFLYIELQNGKTQEELRKNDSGREFILPLIKEGSKFSNKHDSEYGYNVLNGFEIDERKCVIVKACEGDEIVLATDGYPCLKKTLEESENALKEIVENDPLCMKIYKSTKGLMEGYNSFDDRTYIRFII